LEKTHIPVHQKDGFYSITLTFNLKNKTKQNERKLGAVAQAYNPSYWGGL
jgi:hypothetical protein